MFSALVLNSIQLCKMHYYYNYFTDEKIVNLLIKQQGCSDVGIQLRESALEPTPSSTSPADVPHIPHADSQRRRRQQPQDRSNSCELRPPGGRAEWMCKDSSVRTGVEEKAVGMKKERTQSPREPTESFKYHTKTSIRFYICVTRVLFFCIQYRQEKVTFYQK